MALLQYAIINGDLSIDGNYTSKSAIINNANEALESAAIALGMEVSSGGEDEEGKEV